MPELLAPAGSVEALNAAIGEGADAVYLGLKTFNARLRTQNFSWREAEAATQALHKLGKKLFITVNTVCTEDETEELYRFLSYIDKIKCDGIIVQDFAVIRMVQEFFPHINVHASTQMAVASSAAVNRLSKNGVKRVVLARELSLEEIRSVKEHTSCEIEVFVHGALCVSCSGLCMFSSYLGGKSANRGMCTQACRRLYKAYSFSENEKKAYFFSPNDLELIAAVPDLVSAGVDSFKIEGRMKSAEYVGAVTAAYRHVLDNYQDDAKAAIETAKRILASDFGRSKTRYWFDARQSGANLAEESRGIAEKTLNPEQAGGTGIYLGKLKDAANGFAHLSGDYVPEAGDTIRIHRSDDSGRVSHKLKDVTVSDSGVCKIDIPQALAPAGGFKSGDDVYLLQTKQMTKRYAQALPRDLKKFYAKPDNLQLPILDLTPSQHELPGRENARIERENARIDEKKFPEGVYIQVSTLRDLHACLAEHPVRLILELNHETFSALCRKKIAPPVSPRQLFLSLDPFCPESQERDTENYVHELIAMGYTNWIVNSLSHFAFFRSGENRSENRTENRCFLVGGPYLYVFNRWAASFLENQGVSAFIPAIENSQKNIESIFEMNVRAKVLVTVFSYPALFRIRFPLPADYDFVYFEDKEGEVFKALSGEDGSFVLPEKPFCVTSSASKLLNAGFKRVLIDYSKTQVQKKDLKKVLQSLYQSKPLSETERFNWKEGFYTTRDRALPPEAHQNQPARHGGRYAR
ncbi:MAG: peptidase U32 family protein [Treponemataceae bacterium]|nr:MAG: peptidase U32 family protein [Treponemataceae bacterium]